MRKRQPEQPLDPGVRIQRAVDELWEVFSDLDNDGIRALAYDVDEDSYRGRGAVDHCRHSHRRPNRTPVADRCQQETEVMMMVVSDWAFETLLKMANLHGEARLQRLLDDNPNLFRGRTRQRAEQLRQQIIDEAAERYVKHVADRAAEHILAADYRKRERKHKPDAERR
jgi:hypothetical protein